ncbi:MAG TPA: heparinase II/III family protein, partial [Steroidobacteraceae bacterium]|nr:heparinase II/III family protein [Steroidobacteraceae bacterium]
MKQQVLRVASIGATLVKTYGYRGLRRRITHELRKRGNAFAAKPAERFYGALPTPTFSYAPAGSWESLAPTERTTIVARAQRVLDGCYEAYGYEWRRFPVRPNDWRIHPSTGFEFPFVEWWRVPLLPREADVKDVWEPARFSWAYDLIRAYAATREPHYAAAFHARFAQWMDANPPFIGPHWACGQETAIRALAILHAMDTLPTEDAQARQRTVDCLAWSGERIADAIGYGLSQRNNHGISEAAGLVHLGIRLSSVHPDAQRWLRKGLAFLNEQIEDQFAHDGWYAQHSFTYMRVALEQSLCAQRVLEANGLSLSKAALVRLDAAIALFTSVVAGANGVVPNHGANDGARVLPLALSDYRDFRPLLTYASVLRGCPLPDDVPSNAEMHRWLGKQPCRSPDARRDGIETGASGWVVVRLRGWFVFLRAGVYRHRPSHLDALHIDVRHDDREIVTDAGTFAYNAPPPWKNGLGSGLSHNGPILNEREPAERGPHFLWLTWPQSTVQVDGDGSVLRLVAERDGLVRREVIITAAAVNVIDTALQPATSLQVTWLLHPDLADAGRVSADGATSIEAVEGALAGWFSPTYGLRRR